MPKLIKDGALADNRWALPDDVGVGADEGIVLPLADYLAKVEGDGVPADQYGVLLTSADNVQALKPYVAKVPIVVISFQAFADGRSFSQAHILREQLDYEGEIRAAGAFIQDQMFYLKRCGINSFLLADDADIDSCLGSLADFSEVYQAGCDEPQPLFRRRL